MEGERGFRSNRYKSFIEGNNWLKTMFYQNNIWYTNGYGIILFVYLKRVLYSDKVYYTAEPVSYVGLISILKLIRQRYICIIDLRSGETKSTSVANRTNLTCIKRVIIICLKLDHNFITVALLAITLE